MRASQASRQIKASKVLDLILTSDRTRARIISNHQIGDTAPVAAPSPEAANNGSGRGAGICLGAPPLSQPFNDGGGQHAKRHRPLRPLCVSFHGRTRNAEAR